MEGDGAMQIERTAKEARRCARVCAALLQGAQSPPARRFYQHLHESWVRTANLLEMIEATQASEAVRLSWVGERG
jgi:hypothetical protein